MPHPPPRRGARPRLAAAGDPVRSVRVPDGAVARGVGGEVEVVGGHGGGAYAAVPHRRLRRALKGDLSEFPVDITEKADSPTLHRCCRRSTNAAPRYPVAKNRSTSCASWSRAAASALRRRPKGSITTSPRAMLQPAAARPRTSAKGRKRPFTVTSC